MFFRKNGILNNKPEITWIIPIKTEELFVVMFWKQQDGIKINVNTRAKKHPTPIETEDICQ